MPSSSTSAVDTRSRWDAFFNMHVMSASVSASVSYDDNNSTKSYDESRESQNESYDVSEDYTDDYTDEYDSDRENRSSKSSSFSLFGNRKREKKSEDDDHSLEESKSAIFPNIVTKMNESISNPEPFTLVPFNNRELTQFMVLAPKSIDNTIMLSPQALRTVALKRGLSNTSTRKKKIFQVKTKKSPVKKPFMKVNPKTLEKKYNEFQTKRKKQAAERRQDHVDRRKSEVDDYRDGVDREGDYQEPNKFVKTISNLFYPAQKSDEINCYEDELSAEKPPKQRGSFSLPKSSSKSASDGKELVGIEVSFTSDDMECNEKRRGKLNIRNFFRIGKRKVLSKSGTLDTDFGEKKGFARKLTVKDFSSMNENDVIINKSVVYFNFGGNPKKSIDIIECKEKLIPEEDSEEVLVQVEASTVSKTDCFIRNERLWTQCDKNILPITPGVDVVGYVVKCGDKAKSLYGIQENDRVAALIQTGGNSKYVLEHANQLVKVPKQLDAAKAAVLIEIYLSAFQILLHELHGHDRYKERPLEGKEVLVIGGISTINQAIIELAVLLGAKLVYTTAVQKHVDFLQNLGATVLDMAIDNWLPEVKGQMDIVVDSLCEDQYKSSYEALSSNGKLICHCVQTLDNKPESWMTPLQQMWIQTKTACMPRTYDYDVYSYWEKNLEESKNDLSFLFELLQKKAINPSIADTLPLRKVSKAHVFLEAPRRIQGSFVCLPHLES